MRVLMVAERYRPAIGGVEKHIEHVVDILNSRGLHVTILAGASSPLLPCIESSEQCMILRVPQGWGKNPFLFCLWTLYNRRAMSNFDLFHFHDTLVLMSCGIPLMLLQPRTPRFATFHGYEQDPVPMVWQVARRIASRLVRGSICVGSFIRKAYGIHCDLDSIGAVERPGPVVGGGKGAIFVGRLEEDTGILKYVDALRIVRDRYLIDLPLTVCGSGSLDERVREAAFTARLAAELLGPISSPMTVLAKGQVCLAAGYLSMLEAMSTGLPVIGIAKSPLRMAYLKSMRGAGAPISIQTTTDGVAREIARIIGDDRLRASLANRGRAFAAKMTWERMTDLYIQLWSKGSAPKP